MSLEHRNIEKSLCDNDLQRFLDFLRTPRNDAVERVKGITHGNQPID